MKSSWKIGTLAGIELRLHITFPLLLIWVGTSYYSARHSWSDAVSGVAFTLTLFAIIVLHELGHALTARRYGVGTKDITLLPIGGVARLDRIPENPKQELMVALAGPAVNVVLALLFFIVISALSGVPSFADLDELGSSFLVRLMWVNIFIVLFNMLPAFPMDGGRVLRAILAMRMNYVRATTIAATIGQGMAWLLGIAGLFYNPFLVLIAVFVWMGAAQEAGAVRMKSSLEGVTVDDVMMTDFRALTSNCTLARAVEHVLAGFQQDFPIVENNKPIGVLTRSDLLTALAHQGREASVVDAMQKNFCTARVGEPVTRALSRLNDEACKTVFVLRDGELAGVLSSENLGEYMMIQAALQESEKRA
jgi:Zn-dependent protease/predicted transcriptional regulator